MCRLGSASLEVAKFCVPANETDDMLTQTTCGYLRLNRIFTLILSFFFKHLSTIFWPGFKFINNSPPKSMLTLFSN